MSSLNHNSNDDGSSKENQLEKNHWKRVPLEEQRLLQHLTDDKIIEQMIDRSLTRQNLKSFITKFVHKHIGDHEADTKQLVQTRNEENLVNLYSIKCIVSCIVDDRTSDYYRKELFYNLKALLFSDFHIQRHNYSKSLFYTLSKDLADENGITQRIDKKMGYQISFWIHNLIDSGKLDEDQKNYFVDFLIKNQEFGMVIRLINESKIDAKHIDKFVTEFIRTYDVEKLDLNTKEHTYHIRIGDIVEFILEEKIKGPSRTNVVKKIIETGDFENIEMLAEHFALEAVHQPKKYTALLKLLNDALDRI